jgi:hypothetical protein
VLLLVGALMSMCSRGPPPRLCRRYDGNNFARHLPNMLAFNPRHCVPTTIIDKQDDSYLHDTDLPTVCGEMPHHLPDAVRKSYPKIARKFVRRTAPTRTTPRADG